MVYNLRVEQNTSVASADVICCKNESHENHIFCAPSFLISYTRFNLNNTYG